MGINIGDKVAYSVQFLRSIGSSHSNLGRARGVVTGMTRLGELALADIDWEDNEIPARVNISNLAKVGPNRRFCNCD